LDCSFGRDLIFFSGKFLSISCEAQSPADFTPNWDPRILLKFPKHEWDGEGGGVTTNRARATLCQGAHTAQAPGPSRTTCVDHEVQPGSLGGSIASGRVLLTVSRRRLPAVIDAPSAPAMLLVWFLFSRGIRKSRRDRCSRFGCVAVCRRPRRRDRCLLERVCPPNTDLRQRLCLWSPRQCSASRALSGNLSTAPWSFGAPSCLISLILQCASASSSGGPGTLRPLCGSACTRSVVSLAGFASAGQCYEFWRRLDGVNQHRVLPAEGSRSKQPAELGPWVCVMTQAGAG